MVQCSIHKRLALAICNKHITLPLIAPFDSSTKTKSGGLLHEAGCTLLAQTNAGDMMQARLHVSVAATSWVHKN